MTSSGIPNNQRAAEAANSHRRWWQWPCPSLLCLIVVSLMLIGCSPEPTTATQVPGWDKPAFVVDDSCSFGLLYCARIRGGIDFLWGSSDAICRGYGALASGRYNALAYGYRNGAYPSEEYWYTHMHADNSFPSHFGPDDGNVFINAGAWTSSGTSTPCSMAGVIAHEEVHQQGWDDLEHTTGEANNVQTRCGCGT